MITFADPKTDGYSYHWPGVHNTNTLKLVSRNAKLSEIYNKMLEAGGGVYVVDFDDSCRFIGYIGITEFAKAINWTENICTLTAEDIANTNCCVATLETLDNDISLLEKYSHLPVVDSDERFQFYVCQKSNWGDWAENQKFEINAWRNGFNTNNNNEGFPKRLIDRICVCDESVIQLVLEKANGTVIEVGAGPFLGYIWSIPKSKRRIIIEPLADKYAALREEYGLKIPNSADIETYLQGADIFIPELASQADVVLCQNALDHTPEWPFVLGNIARYMKKDSILYLGTDIDHHASDVPGHHNITYNPDKLYSLLNALGFELIYKQCYTRTIGNTFCSVVGTKTANSI